jgi:hypothetical protein
LKTCSLSLCLIPWYSCIHDVYLVYFIYAVSCNIPGQLHLTTNYNYYKHRCFAVVFYEMYCDIILDMYDISSTISTHLTICLSRLTKYSLTSVWLGMARYGAGVSCDSDLTCRRKDWMATDLSPVTYSDWNFRSFEPQAGEYCAQLFPEGWQGVQCDSHARFFCSRREISQFLFIWPLTTLTHTTHPLHGILLLPLPSPSPTPYTVYYCFPTTPSHPIPTRYITM